jgi:WD40 repeat protein
LKFSKDKAVFCEHQARKFAEEFGFLFPMQSDEELRDARYFPSMKEQTILLQTIEKYFRLPERSEERSAVVQTVTSQLVEINPRWTNRAVRLWFNNNKRTCLKGSVQFDPAQTRGTALTADQMPLKKRPPRPSSVGSTAIPSPPSPDSSRPDSLSAVLRAASQRGHTDDEKKTLENDLTDRLIDLVGTHWRSHVACPEDRFAITARDSMPGTTSPNSNPITVPAELISKFSSLDCGIIVDGLPAVVEVDHTQQTRHFCLGDRVLPLDFPFTAPGIGFDRPGAAFFVSSGTFVYQILTSDFSIPQLLFPRCGPMLRCSIAALSDSIIVGTRRHLYLWSRESLSMTYPHNHCPFTGIIEVSLPSITSISAMEAGIAVASRNYHAVHVIGSDGMLVRSCVGHGGGVTALANVADSVFVSGSADLTARIWDVRSESPAAQLQRHKGPLTVVASAEAEGNHYVITGGEDRIVRGWDIRAQKPYVEVDTGIGIPIAVHVAPDGEIMVLTKEKETTCAEGYQMVHWNECQLFDMCPSVAFRCRPQRAGFPGLGF